MGNLFPNRWREDRPPSLEEFTREFPDDYACADYLAKRRWRSGFKCIACGGNDAWRLESRPWLWQCKGIFEDEDGIRHRTGCNHQTSLISGTIMHGTHVPLRKWFLAAFLVATHSNSISALQLQPKIGVGYKTAWLMLHKLRRAMIDPDRKPLDGVVEVDETSIPYRKNTDPVGNSQGKSPIGKLFVIGAVEVKEGRYPGRCRLERLRGIDHNHLHGFIKRNTTEDSLIVTDGNTAYRNMTKRGHKAFNLSEAGAPKAHVVLPWVHRVFSNFKRWANGTFHGVREKHLNFYLEEFVFRWNRRRQFQSNTETVFSLIQKLAHIDYRGVVGDTWQWRKDRQEQILKMVSPKRKEAAWSLALATGMDIFDALDEIRKSEIKHVYSRREPRRPILPPRRPGEERNTRRYIHPPRLEPLDLGSPPLAHIPLNSQITIPRQRRRNLVVA